MPRVIGKLTSLAVTQARRRGYYGDGGGLYLQVGATGAKSWVFRFKAPHPERPGAFKLREMGLGSVHTISLAAARERARQCREARLDDRDPIEARHAERAGARIDAAKAMTFRECAQRYVEAHRAAWKNPKHAAQWPATLETYVYPVMGALPVPAIDTGLVVKVVEPLWSTKPETASRVRGRIETILDYAAVRGWRQGDNPARWRGHLDKLLPKKVKVARAKQAATGRGEHHAAMPYAEIGGFLAKLRQQNGIAAAALEFAILTAARTGEVIAARWEEIDPAERMWTVPAARMKAGREHRVPLSPAALAILNRTPQERRQGLVFPGAVPARPISNMAMLMLLRRLGRDDITVHGFRSTFRDWAAERTNFPAEVAEMALAHAVGDKVEAAYRRGDLFEKRRQLAEAWAKFCEQVTAGGKVVAIRRG
jgi:integrase